MKERPIIMGAESVRAVLSGRKSQTRRVIKPQPKGYRGGVRDYRWEIGDIMMYQVWPHKLVESRGRDKAAAGELTPVRMRCPYGIVGDHLWVRETWKRSLTAYHYSEGPHGGPDDPCCGYKATMTYTCGEPIPDYPITWKSPIYMPKKFARTWLEITDVRVDKVTSLSYNDAVAEGCESVAAFRELWDKLNAKRGAAWEKEPWVWVVGFQKV
jgi:hypothetical protein